MRFIAAISIILAYGPAIFDLALTGRGVSRPTQTSTTDWALAQFYTLHTGRLSLAILPTGLGGAVLTESDHGHNNQDSTVPIWTTVHATSRRALANLSSFVNPFKRRRLDRQWRYIRGWWRYNSGRVIEDALIVYFYSMPFLTVVLRIWRKRLLRQRRSESKRTATLAQPSPIMTTSVTITSLARTDSIQTTKRDIPTFSCTRRAINIVAIGGASTPSLDHILRHPAFDFRGCLRVISTPTESPTEFIPPQLLGALTAYTGTVSIYKKLRVGREVSGAPTAPTRLGSGPKSSQSQRIVVITLVVLLEGFVIIHYEAVDGIAFWTVTLIVNPGTSYASAVSRHAASTYRIVPKRTVTFPTCGLIEAGSPQFEIPSICSPNPRRLYRSNGMALPRISLARPQDSGTIERDPISRRLYGHHLKTTFLSHPLLRPSSTVMKISAITDLNLHGTHPYTWSRATSRSATLFQTVSHVELKTQVVLAQFMNTSDASNMDQSKEEEIEDSNTVDAAFIPLPPSRPTSPEAEEVSDTFGEEFLQADLIPLPESRPESPELHGPDPLTRSLDMYQYIAALTHQYLSLRAMLFRPILPEESRAIRAELRPRLSGLRERALIRQGLGSPAPGEAELEVHEEEEVVVAEEVQEEGQEEEQEQVEEEPGEDLEIDPSAENHDVGNIEDASRRPFRLKIPIAVIRHISTNII